MQFLFIVVMAHVSEEEVILFFMMIVIKMKIPFLTSATPIKVHISMGLKNLRIIWQEAINLKSKIMKYFQFYLKIKSE